MQIRWQITSKDIKRIQGFVRERRHNPFVEYRNRRDLADRKPPVGESAVWFVHVGCLLTTQQRSGPGTAVFEFMRKRPFPLGYQDCRRQKQLAQFCLNALGSNGGIRRTKTIAQQAALNLQTLEAGSPSSKLVLARIGRHWE